MTEKRGSAWSADPQTQDVDDLIFLGQTGPQVSQRRAARTPRQRGRAVFPFWPFTFGRSFYIIVRKITASAAEG